jgi:predicted ester cyclase
MNHQLPGDEEISRILIGCWSGVEITHDIPMQYLTWYYADQTLVSKGFMVAGGKRVDFTTKGIWNVKDGKLNNKVTESTVTSLVGQTLINAFTAADETTTVFVSSENALVVNSREDADDPDLDFHDRLVVRTYQIMVEFNQTDKNQYGHWLSDDVVVVDMPTWMHERRETKGLSDVLAEIVEYNKFVTYDFAVKRVVGKTDVFAFETAVHLTVNKQWKDYAPGNKIEFPTCSIFEIGDGKIVKQTNYIASHSHL